MEEPKQRKKKEKKKERLITDKTITFTSNLEIIEPIQLVPLISIIKVDTVILNNSISIDLFNPKELKEKQIDKFSIDIIKIYSGIFYSEFNEFIRTSDEKQYRSIIQTVSKYELISELYNIYPEQNNMKYFETLIYYYYIYLYNSVKNFPKLDKPFKTLRGVSNFTYYMSDDSTTHYLTDFLSTTPSLKVAAGYSYGPKEENERFNIITFIVYPYCEYAYIAEYSHHPNENEILLSPFNRYLYVTSKELTKEELYEFIENDPDNNYNAFEETYLQRGINMGYFLVLPPDFNSELNANDIKEITKQHIPFGSNKSNTSLFGSNEDPVILTKNRTPKEHHIVNHFKKLIK